MNSNRLDTQFVSLSKDSRRWLANAIALPAALAVWIAIQGWTANKGFLVVLTGILVVLSLSWWLHQPLSVVVSDDVVVLNLRRGRKQRLPKKAFDFRTNGWRIWAEVPSGHSCVKADQITLVYVRFLSGYTQLRRTLEDHGYQLKERSKASVS